MKVLHVPTLTLQEAAPFHDQVPVEPISFQICKHTVVLMTSHPTLRREAEGKVSGSLDRGLGAALCHCLGVGVPSSPFLFSHVLLAIHS